MVYQPSQRNINNQIKLLFRRGASGNEAQRALEGTEYQATRYRVQKIYSEMRQISASGSKANHTRNDFRPNSSQFPTVETFSNKELHYGVSVVLYNPENNETIERLINVSYDSDVTAGRIKVDAENAVSFLMEKYDMEIRRLGITEAYRKRR